MPAKHPGLVVSVVRDAAAKDFNLEVLIAVTPVRGKGPLKWLVANLPGGTERAMTHLFSHSGRDVHRARRKLVSASVSWPGSVHESADRTARLSAVDGYRSKAPQMVSELKRISGKDPMSDGNGGPFGIIGATELSLRTKICADETGRVATVGIVQSSGNPKYDRYIVGVVKDWVYGPYVVAGKPHRACMNASFMAHFLYSPGVRDGLGLDVSRRRDAEKILAMSPQLVSQEDVDKTINAFTRLDQRSSRRR